MISLEIHLCNQKSSTSLPIKKTPPQEKLLSFLLFICLLVLQFGCQRNEEGKTEIVRAEITDEIKNKYVTTDDLQEMKRKLLQHSFIQKVHVYAWPEKIIIGKIDTARAIKNKIDPTEIYGLVLNSLSEENMGKNHFGYVLNRDGEEVRLNDIASLAVDDLYPKIHRVPHPEDSLIPDGRSVYGIEITYQKNGSISIQDYVQEVNVKKYKLKFEIPDERLLDVDDTRKQRKEQEEQEEEHK